MEGTDIEDDETKEDIRMEISEFFENYLDTLFIDMVLNVRVNVSKEAFLLLILVQKFRGATSIVKDKESLESICNSFMRDSKVIRALAMDFMRLVMKPDKILTFILECLDKYVVSVSEILESIFDREIFAQWKLYGDFLDAARNKKRSVNVVTQIIRQSLVLLTKEYQEYEQNNPNEEILHDAKIDILEFLRIFPKFLYVYRVTAPNPESYTKILKTVDAVNFADVANDVTEICLENLVKELFAGIENFEVFPVIDAVTTALLKLEAHFELQDAILDPLMYYSGVFAQITEIEDEKAYKRATYFVYSCLATKPTLLEDKIYEDVFTDFFETMTDDEILEKVGVRCAVLAVVAQILTRCFKIVVKKGEGRLSLDEIEAAMKVVLQKMRAQMTKTTESRVVVLSDMKIIMINAANLMHYLTFRNHEAEIFTSTFSCIVKLTEMILTVHDIQPFFQIFKDFYDVHYQIIQNHEEIVLILRHFGQPTLQKHIPTFAQVLLIPHSRDLTPDKKYFRSLIVKTIILIANEANITLFWTAFRHFLTVVLKLKSKDFLTFVANMTFEILQQQLLVPQVPEMTNRFQILRMMTEIVEDMRKSPAVMTSVIEGFSQMQRMHQQDFTEDENQEIKEFMKELGGSKSRRVTRTLRDES
ncbi:uncharacterized protein LOC134830113 [Culicoides brevitarsis]|uniref:uncharacterized protein LOC134830113 n=1 Tax=Culicoides brevitarsis TaxID=469753 RepID=UPI00307CB240